MKKITALILICFILLLTAFSAAAYEQNIKLVSGLNPVITVDGDTFQYTLIAKNMENMTNGDFTIHYDGALLQVISAEATVNCDMTVINDTGDKVFFSFMFEEKNNENELAIITVTFRGNPKKTCPETEITNLAGTYIKKVAAPVFLKETSPVQQELIGDIDGNGKITAADARLALRIAAGLETVSPQVYVLADINRDGRVTAADARTILRTAAGLETSAS